MSSISAGLSDGTALVSTGDTTGELVLKTNGGTTAVTIGTDQSVTFAGAVSFTGGALPVASGGTGATTLTSNNVLVGNGTSAVQFVAPGTSGNVLTSNGTAWVSQAISAGGNYIQRVYTSPATWTKPAGIKAVKVTVLGGGGGGNGGRGTPGENLGRQGAGGGGGGVAIEYLSGPTIPGPVAVTVGAGGAGGPAPGTAGTVTAGGTGGTSSFGGFLSATGGAGAPQSGFVDASVVGAGGSGSGGQINITGSAGFGRLNEQAAGFKSPAPNYHRSGGGASPLFITGYGRNAITGPGPSGVAGESAVANQGGGGGGHNSVAGPGSAGVPVAGGSGGAGLVIVEEFY